MTDPALARPDDVAALLDTARAWARTELNPEHVATLEAEIAEVEAGSATALASLRSRFSGPLAFGTAGLRAEEGPGESRMNRLVVRRTAAGIARYLWDVLGPEEAAPTVVIGYDARRGSADFARDSAAVFTAAGAHVVLAPRPLPTPLLAFWVRHLHADAGIMVTASHNPPSDNGYKVYLGGRMTDEAGRGAQIVAPADAEIAARIPHGAGVAEIELAADGWEIAGEDLVDAYRDAALSVLDPELAETRSLRLVYTPLHGVGGEILPTLLAEAGFTAPHTVPEQAEPDPAFPTVSFPNPEEPGAMDLALAAAREHAADLVIANDPDADRLALAARTAEGDYRMLTGDQVGVLLGAHLLPRLAAMGRSTAASLVSSPQLGQLAAAAGVDHYITLTGFKWISRAPELGYGYEEALGYCVAPDLVRDKDGLTAALVAAECVAQLVARGQSVFEALAALDADSGSMPSTQVSVRVSDLSLIADTMARLRQDPPRELAGDAVTEVEDLAVGTDALPATDGLVFHTVTGSRVVIRPSGTEPKLKAYLGTTDADSRRAQDRLAQLRDAVERLVQSPAAPTRQPGDDAAGGPGTA
ncbi:MAG: phospho-sugar mutase [Micrococcus sp.]|nr:phospho-sugar mutase [Micrococcus sp.]